MTSVGLTPKMATQPGSSNAPLQGMKKHGWVLSILLVIVTVALYYQVSDHPFVNYDDNVYVTDNAQIKSGLNWDTVQWAFTTSRGGELASAYLALARSRLSAFSGGSCWPPQYQFASACPKCPAAVLGAAGGDWLYRPQLDGSGAVCLASY